MADWSEDEITEQVKLQRAGEDRHGRSEVAREPTPFAIRCITHGRRMLTSEEMGISPWSWGAVDLDVNRDCPICKKSCRLDLYWNANTRNRLSDI